MESVPGKAKSSAIHKGWPLYKPRGKLGQAPKLSHCKLRYWCKNKRKCDPIALSLANMLTDGCETSASRIICAANFCSQRRRVKEAWEKFPHAHE